MTKTAFDKIAEALREAIAIVTQTQTTNSNKRNELGKRKSNHK